MGTLAAQTGSDRAAAIYARLKRRNQLVGALRIGLPVAGVLIAAAFMLKLFASALFSDITFERISIDRENLVVEAPSYSGVGTDGSAFTVSAGAARTAFDDPDVVELTTPKFSLTQTNGTRFEAESSTAQLTLATQIVVAREAVAVHTSTGLSGTIADAVLEIEPQLLTASGGADLAFGDAATIKAEAMSYDGQSRIWRFRQVVVDMAMTPGEAPPAPRVRTE